MRVSRFISLALATATLGCLGAGCPPLDALDCPNPAVTAFDVEVVSKSNSSGTVRFTAVVRNIGLQPFESSPGQQAVQLWANGNLVAQVEFEDLAPGDAVTLTDEEPWSTATEFPPTYEARIAYDPDIFIDGNPQNDDCNTDDNSATLTPDQINAVFNAAE